MPLQLQDALAFAESCPVAVLGTLSASGVPQTAAMGIVVTPAFEIIFDTLNTTRKYPNLKSHPQCSFAMWQGERSLQYEGLAFEPSGGELTRYQELYFAKMPGGRDRLSWPGMTYFVVRPVWLRYTDYNTRPPAVLEHRFSHAE